MGVRTANVQDGNIGETLCGLAEVIHGRRDASPESSYTARLLQGEEDELLKKIAEEASEVIMACKDNDHDHIRYEAGDLVYHLMVTLERYGVTLPELAGELDARRSSSDGAAGARRPGICPVRGVSGQAGFSAYNKRSHNKTKTRRSPCS